MKISVSEFNTKCTNFFCDVANLNQTIEISERGKIVEMVTSSSIRKIDPRKFLGCLHVTVTPMHLIGIALWAKMIGRPVSVTAIPLQP